MSNAALGSLVDELGDLELELAPLKAKIARADVLRSAIRGAYKDASPVDSYQAHGARWSTLIGPMGNQSVVDVAGLFQRVGEKTFLGMATVSLKAITEKCGAEVLGSVVSIRPSGPRALATIPKAPEPVKPPRKNARKSNV